MKVSIIVAASQNWVIGKDNQLIWRLSSDLKRFKSLTTGHTIIMGRKTFESIGKPLPDRKTIIVSRQENYQQEGCTTVESLDKALEISKEEKQVFVIGGGMIYQEAIDKADQIYFTKVQTKVEGDTFFPPIDKKIWDSVHREDHLPDEKNEYPYSFIDYKRK